MTDPNEPEMIDPNKRESAPEPTAPHQTDPGNREATAETTADPIEQDAEPRGSFGAVRPDLA